MPEIKKIYTVTDDLRKIIGDFLESPFDNIKESIELVRSKDTFTEEEINQIINLLGKFPAYLVYPIIDSFKGNLKIEEVEQPE
jgi:hypothetical protein